MDPGWKPAIRGTWRWFLFQFGLRRSDKPTLVVLRSLFLMAPITWFLFATVLVALSSDASSRPPWLLPAIVAAGIVDVGLALWLKSLPLKSSDSSELAASYSAQVIVGWSFASASVLWGFVGFFMGGGMLAYAAGVPFGLAGLLLMAPTTSNIARYQQKLRESGTPLSLLEALMRPFEPPTRSRPAR